MSETFVLLQLLLLVVALGLLGNMLTYKVFSRRRFTELPFAKCMKIKMITDSIVLTFPIREYLYLMFNVDIYLFSSVLCKTYNFSVIVCQSVSLWVLALAGLERLLNVLYPLRLKGFMKSSKLRAYSLLAITSYSMIITLPRFIYTDIYPVITNTTNYSTCSIVDPFGARLTYAIVGFNIVFVIMVVSNFLSIALLVYLRRSSSKIKFMSLCKKRLRMKRDRKLTVSLISLNLACLMCKLPIIIVIFVNLKRGVNMAEFENDHTATISTIIGALVFVIDNASCFLTTYLVNSLFRSEFKQMLGWTAQNMLDQSTSTVNQEGLNLKKCDR